MSSSPRTLGFRERGRARRRLRYLRRLRELQVRDVGGFTFDLYRFGEHREQLMREKLEAIIATDKEIRALAELLGESGTERVQEVRRSGVGGTCANCGAFHAGDARFCDRCGVELAVVTADAPAAEPPQDTEGSPAPSAEEEAEAAERASASEEEAAEPVETASLAVRPPSDNGPAPDAGPSAAEGLEERAEPGWARAEEAGKALADDAARDADADRGEKPDTGELAAVGSARTTRGRGRARARAGVVAGEAGRAVSPTAIESPPTPRCTRCGAPMAPEQDWCLECGTAVTTRVVPPPGRLLPIVVVAAALVLVAIVLAVTVGPLSDGAEEAAGGGAQAAATTPARTATTEAPRGGEQRARGRRERPASAVPGAEDAAGGGPVPVWPKSKEAYTLVVLTTGDRAGAERKARVLIADGENAGILRTDGYEFFTAGYWVAWAGQYPDRPAAEKDAQRVQKAEPAAYVTLMRRQAS